PVGWRWRTASSTSCSRTRSRPRTEAWLRPRRRDTVSSSNPSDRGARMKAIVLREIGGPEKLQLDTVADPSPGPREVVVRLKAAALNHRDVWIRKGMYAGIKLPVILGSDGAGVIESAGLGVNSPRVGAEIVINPGLDWGDDPQVQGPNFRILGLPDDG